MVTGSVTAGSLRVGDEVEWLPRRERVRVRSLQNHDQPVEEVHRGMRAAINLAGVHHEDVLRGQELATPGYLEPSRVVTVRLHCLADARRPIKHRLPVRFHLGTAEIMSTVSLLDCDAIEPGQWGLAQLFLDEPVTATWGQPFVIRESVGHTDPGRRPGVAAGRQENPPPSSGNAGAHRTSLERRPRRRVPLPWPGSAVSVVSRLPTWYAGPASDRRRPRN